MNSSSAPESEDSENSPSASLRTGPSASSEPPIRLSLRALSEVEARAKSRGSPAGLRNGEPPGAVLLLHRQRAIRADWDEVGTFLSRLSSQVARSGFSVCFLSDQGIRRYNKRFRGKDQATDVLSFPIEEHRNGRQDYLGDILISVETAQENARRYRLRLEEEIKVLALHGVLHLLGYDHERDDGEMARVERRWSRKLGLSQNLTGRSRQAPTEAAGPGGPRR